MFRGPKTLFIPPAVSRVAPLEERLRRAVRLVPLPLRRVRLVGAADVTFLETKDRAAAVVVLFDMEAGVFVEEATAVVSTPFPYVPGYLAYREGPAILSAWRKLRRKPDALLFDGHGIAHPRRFGIASHLGVLLDLPSVGCAKKPLVGTFEEPGRQKGDFAPLVHEGETLGAVVRTREGVKPVFVSPGHRADLPTAVALVLSLCTRFRIPEPARRAHELTRTMRAAALTARSGTI